MSASTTTSFCTELLDFIERSPSPWHAVANASQQLCALNFHKLDEKQTWTLTTGGRYFVTRDDGSLIAFIVGSDVVNAGFRIIGAHTDSPCLRVKTHGAHDSGGYLRLATEIYGGPILATFTDRDLLLAGRVMVRDAQAENGFKTVLVRLNDSLVRLPNLAIHLNRAVNDDGLKIHKHNGLNLLLSTLGDGDQPLCRLRDLLAQECGVAASQLLSVELCVVDAQAPSYFGANKEFIAARQLDNLASCHAAIKAIATVGNTAHTSLIALFDHEEVGSESTTGAAGNFLESVLQRITTSQSPQHDALARASANSWHLSADMAHAHHPSHNECFDGLHHLKVNAGVVLKINASQRYATNALGEAFFTQLCESAAIPMQKYVHRADLACGTTIGPVSAARLGIKTFDVGAPMWAMHSARESAGALDHAHYINLMTAFLSA